MKRTILIFSMLLLAGCAEAPAPPPAEPTFVVSQAERTSTNTSPAEAAVPQVLSSDVTASSAEALSSDVAASNTEGFPFEYNGVVIHVGMPAGPILQQLGEPLNYFEAPSCAFDGIDRTYFYSGFELHTFPRGDNDYILTVMFTDDSVETPGGVYLGMCLDEAIAIYGDDYEQNGGQYTYTKGQGALRIMTENGVVVEVSYVLL